MAGLRFVVLICEIVEGIILRMCSWTVGLVLFSEEAHSSRHGEDSIVAAGRQTRAAVVLWHSCR